MNKDERVSTPPLRQLGRLVLLLVALAALVAFSCSAPRARPDEPWFPAAPIVLVSIDTLRADHLPAWGYSRGATPAIDQLARESIRFESAFSPCPLTLPAHLSLLGGRTPAEHGVRDNLGYHHDAARHATLPSWLATAGYRRGAAVSAWVLRGSSGLASEFDLYDDEILAPSRELAASAAAAQRPGGVAADRLARWIADQGERPFFAWLHLYEPHAPYSAPEPYASRSASPYDAEVTAADAVLGRFLAALRERGIYDRAIVVLVSDHGEGLGEHGEVEHGILLNRWALHVPLLLKLPHGVRGGETVTTPAGLIDLAPTLARLVGVTPPAEVGDRSLLDTEKLARRAERGLYAETWYPRIHLGWSELTALFAGRDHFIEGGGRELYDWQQDPRELADRSRSEPERSATLAAALARQRRPFAAPAPSTADEIAAVRSLGYLGGAAATAATSDLPAPRTRIQLVSRLSEALRLAAAGERKRALVALRDVARESPDGLDVQLALAELLAQEGAAAEALAAYEQACRLAPALAAELALEIARLHLALGHLPAAEQHARVALASAAGPAHLVLARVALARGDAAGAEREALAAAEPRTASADADSWGAAATIRAELRLRAGDSSAALALLDQAAARREREGVAPIADLELLRGEALARMSRFAEAEAALRREIAAFPRSAQAYARLALVVGFAGRGRAEAEAVLREMQVRSPGPETAELARRTRAALPAAR